LLLGDCAKDLITGGEIHWGKSNLELRPYQALWLLPS
jgi:hypothetical protein